MCISLISVFNSENAMQALNMVIFWLEPSLKDSAACVPTTPRTDKFPENYGLLKLNQRTNTWLIYTRQWNQGKNTPPQERKALDWRVHCQVLPILQRKANTNAPQTAPQNRMGRNTITLFLWSQHCHIMWPIQIIPNQNACVYKMTNCINMTKYNINFCS